MTKLESGAVAPNAAPARSRRDRRQRAAPRRQDPRSGIESRSSSPRTCRCSTLDAVLFEQVLFNLLDNAAKYAPAGTTIRIQSWRDDGIGLPAGARRRRRHSAGDLEQIFDKFYRAQKGDHVRAGTGLGLAISRGFVEAMQRHDRGRQPQRPHGRGVHHPLAGARGSRAQLDTRRMSAAPLKVLVVDDEPPIRKLLRMGLEHAGLRDPRGAERQGRAGACSRRSPTSSSSISGCPTSRATNCCA